MKYLDRILQLKKELDSLRPLNTDDELRIMQKFRLDWNYHSNNLEGNVLTYGETKVLILEGLTAQGKPLKDHFEVIGHDQAINWISEIVKKDRPLTESFIRELHKLILKESYEVEAITPEGNPTKKKIKIGEYKTTANHVKTRTGEIIRFASPEETPSKMGDLLDWYNTSIKKSEVNPILLSAEFHYRFVKIHPFDDGNGRTARLLMNFILMQYGYPPIIIKTQDKNNYLIALQEADSGNFPKFVDYILENLKNSLEIMLKGAKGGSIEEFNDLEKEIAILEQRIKNIGEPINVEKSKRALINIYRLSITEIASLFFSKSELFEKFYVESESKIWVDSSSSNFKRKNEFIRKSIERIREDTISIIISIQYKAFKRIGFKEFNFHSSIEINFYYTKYVIKNQAGVSIEKYYDEYANEDEINSLVNEEIRRHKIFLENKIEEIKKK